MKLRVPDYYEEFHCIADACQDSCCVGWEINIDEDTYDFYSSVEGELGERLACNMYDTGEGEHSFRLVEHGRCPFLNQKNLCDICIELGDAALSEVCTEYPRFTTWCDSLCQKCLSLSCEEVGRILFTRRDPVQLVEYVYGAEEHDEERSGETLLSIAMYRMIALMQNRSFSIEERMKGALSYGRTLQEWWSAEEPEEEVPCFDQNMINLVDEQQEEMVKYSYTGFEKRRNILEEMEVLGEEWQKQKMCMKSEITSKTYQGLMHDFCRSTCYRAERYEQLMGYFLFRYWMNAFYDGNVYGKTLLAVEFTMMIQEMDALRYRQRGGVFTMEDEVDLARIFSKEVEHSEENISFAEEELLFWG